MANPSRLITANLDSEFKNLRQKPSGGNGHTLQRASLATTPEDLPANLGRKVRAQMTGVSPTVDTLVGQMYNPFIQRLSLEEPRSWQERTRWKRYFKVTEPLVSSSVHLHAEFPISNLRIQHEDPEIREFFEDLMDEIQLSDFIVDLAHEYWLIGEASVFGFVDNVTDPTIWTGFVLLDPLNVEPVGSEWVNGTQKERLTLRMSDTVKHLVNNAHDSKFKELAARLPADMQEAARTGQGIALSEFQASRMKAKGSYFSKRGVGIVDSVFRQLMYKDRLRSSQWATMGRNIAPTEFYKIGETGDPASEAEIQAFKDALAATWNDPAKAIVWHHALQVDIQGTQGKMLPIWTEMEGIDKEILIGLMMSDAMLSGEGPTFATSVVAYDVMVNRWMSWRRMLERWIRQRVFAPMCKIHRMYVPEYKVKSSTYRTDAGLTRPFWIPDVRWERQHLKDESSRISLVTELAAKGLLPMEYVYDLLELDAETVESLVDKEMIKRAMRVRRRKDQMQKMGLTLADAMPGQLPNAVDGGAVDLTGGGGGGGDDFGAPEGNVAPDMSAGNLPQTVDQLPTLTNDLNGNNFPGRPVQTNESNTTSLPTSPLG